MPPGSPIGRAKGSGLETGAGAGAGDAVGAGEELMGLVPRDERTTPLIPPVVQRIGFWASAKAGATRERGDKRAADKSPLINRLGVDITREEYASI